MKYLFFLSVLLLFLKSSAQQTERVDFKTIDAEIAIFPNQKKVSGNVTYDLELKTAVDSFFIDAKNMEFSNITFNGKPIASKTTDDKLWIFSKSKKPGIHKLSFNYSARPKQAMYFVGWEYADEVNPQVWTQGQGRYTSHWLPSFDDYNEKTVFNFNIEFQKDFTVVSNGILQEKKPATDSTEQWIFKMEKPMSSYLAAVAIGKFNHKQISSENGTPIKLYYEREDEKNVEPTYRYTKKIFDFLEKETGVAYPWQVYKQIPVRDFLYAGMENTSITIFSDVFVVDSVAFKDRNYVNVNAHEMAHQWFGDMVTATDNSQHWLQEGFATYFALLAEKEVFGEDYFHWKLNEIANQLKERSDAGKGQPILAANANSLTYYQKGAWALHALRDKIGAAAFRETMKNYLEKYKFQNVTTENFIAEAELASGIDLQGYVSQWLKQKSFPGTAAFSILKKSEFLNNYYKLVALRPLALGQKVNELQKALNFPVNDYLGQEVVLQLSDNSIPEVVGLYRKAFETNNVFVRQSIAMTMSEIPLELKTEYESLLQDDSYLTKETALYNLWMNFPEERTNYLDATENVVGFTDKNVRMLWLTLNLVTPEYQPERKQEYYNELSGYTSPKYAFNVRENAYGYLYQLNYFKEENLKNLVESSLHKVIRFRDFSRELLGKLLKQEAYREKFVALLNELPQKQQDFLKQKLQ